MEKEDSERPVSPSPSSAKSRGTNYKRNTKEERAMYIDLRDARVPTCLYWDCDKVGDWIEDLGFPQYRVSALHPLHIVSALRERK